MNIHGKTSDITFTDVIIIARDTDSRIVGNWTTDDPLLRTMSCGGLIHQSKTSKTHVQAFWHAPSNLIGSIRIE